MGANNPSASTNAGAMRTALARLAEGHGLDEATAREAMAELMRGACTPAQIGAFLMGLRRVPLSAELLAGLARAMREAAVRIRPKVEGPLLDLCGTGGAPFKTFNVSTVAAFVAAGAGCPVAKHGNRSATGVCGSADVLEALGVNLNAPPETVCSAIETVGIGFLFAPVFHPAMRHAAGPRRELGFPTVFNLLGPLTNPAGAQAQLLGVARPELVELFPEALRRLGVERALVVHGLDGLDELSTVGPSLVAELRDGAIKQYELRPEAVGLKRAAPDHIGALRPPEAARVALEILRGERRDARYEIVLLNAGAALYAAGRAPTIEAGLALAEQSLREGRALAKLQALIAKTRE